MKHLRKIGILIIAIIMAAAIAVGTCVVYAVRNVNVTLLSYPDGNGEENLDAEILKVKQAVLNKVRGRVISSVGEEDVSTCLDDNYFLESFEKVYPCTINITVQQRREVFAVFDGEVYTTYDDEGKLMRISENNVNFCDGAPNLLLEGTHGEEDVKTVATICAMFKSSENFGSLRSTVEKVTLYTSQTSISTDSDKIIFSLWCGLSIEIRDYPKYTAEKIARAYSEFSKRTPEEKLKGRIYCMANDAGEIRATYNANA
ncbi:MAG: hypothetical protein K2O89_02915 [Clostridia bacterium]|nr:hypothetical protein [Clostridia bacterium]